MEIKTILVVGSGTMGNGIAYTAALSGYNVVLNDVNEDALESARDKIKQFLDGGVQRGKFNKDEGKEIYERVEFNPNLEEKAKEADFVIEAVPEDMDLKKEIFKTLDNATHENTILATNTSTMSPSEIGASTNRSDKVIAMHFFNPVPKMKLVEIVKGLDTSDETNKIVEQVALKLKKEPVSVNEFPGFVTSRISALVGNEAFNMLMEGVGAPEEIDKAIEIGLNYPMGPFKLGDIVGLDVRLRNLEYLHKILGEKFRPSPLLVKYVQAGRLGVKTSKGVYDYS